MASIPWAGVALGQSYERRQWSDLSCSYRSDLFLLLPQFLSTETRAPFSAETTMRLGGMGMLSWDGTG